MGCRLRPGYGGYCFQEPLSPNFFSLQNPLQIKFNSLPIHEVKSTSFLGVTLYRRNTILVGSLLKSMSKIREKLPLVGTIEVKNLIRTQKRIIRLMAKKSRTLQKNCSKKLGLLTLRACYVFKLVATHRNRRNLEIV